MSVADAKIRAMMRRETSKLLPDTCTIQRPTTSRDTAGGVTKTWSTAATGVKCGIVTERQAKVMPDQSMAYETVYRVAVEFGADVRAGDRLTSLVSEVNDYSSAEYIHISQVLPAKALVAVYTVLETDFTPGAPQ